MDPYLERDVVWDDFHERFLILGAGVIGLQVRPNFVVRVNDHIFVQDVADSQKLAGRADLGILPTSHPSMPGGTAAVLEAPVRIRIPRGDETREVFLEILDRQSRQVVTVLELLSPSNKRKNSADRAQYLAKRRAVLDSGAHLVEIDLLRGGQPMPVENRPDCQYSALVSRVEERPDAGFWPLGLADRLPVIPIPLQPPHPEATLDLQALLDRVYDEAGYEYDVYDGPPSPPLDSDEQAWAQRLVPAPS